MKLVAVGQVKSSHEAKGAGRLVRRCDSHGCEVALAGAVRDLSTCLRDKPLCFFVTGARSINAHRGVKAQSVMKIKRETLKRLVTITLEHEPEDHSYQTEFEDDSARDWIREQLQMGNSWAWCQVTVTARLGGFETKDYLGACSYEDEASFKTGGYFESMIDDCVAEMAEEIEKIVNSHDLWDHEAASCLWCAVA